MFSKLEYEIAIIIALLIFIAIIAIIYWSSQYELDTYRREVENDAKPSLKHWFLSVVDKNITVVEPEVQKINEKENEIAVIDQEKIVGIAEPIGKFTEKYFQENKELIEEMMKGDGTRWVRHVKAQKRIQERAKGRQGRSII